MTITVMDVPELDRFEGRLDGELAGYLEYVRSEGVWALNHAFTFPAFRGHGMAGEVTRHALEAARAAGARVRPVCSFVADYIELHREYADLLDTAVPLRATDGDKSET
jgi:predicted GNAT family acetyltransferase